MAEFGMAELRNKDFKRIRDIDRKLIKLKREADSLSSGIDKLRAELKNVSTVEEAHEFDAHVDVEFDKLKMITIFDD